MYKPKKNILPVFFANLTQPSINGLKT